MARRPTTARVQAAARRNIRKAQVTRIRQRQIPRTRSAKVRSKR